LELVTIQKDCKEGWIDLRALLRANSTFKVNAGQLLWEVVLHQSTNQTPFKAKLDEYQSGTYQATLQIELPQLHQSLGGHRTRQQVALIEE